VVRVKTVALTLARQIKAIGVNAAGTAEHDPCATLAAYGRGAMFSLVPLALVRSTSVFSDLGNWFLCRPTEAIALRNRLLSAQLGERERAAHAVSEAAFEAAQRGEWNDFIARRRLEIDALERSFVSDVLARHPALLPPQIG
jgi:hypothetical protein